MVELEFHPVADIFPMMSEQETTDLLADIEANGLRVPIWLHGDGRIIDGRNRYLACREVGVEPETRTYEGDETGLIAFVVSLNLHRRHLNESHRAMVAARIANMTRGGDRRSDQSANLRFDLPIPEGAAAQISNAAAAEMLNVSERSVDFARKVQDQGVPELTEAVMAGDVAVSTAADLAQAPDDQQREVLATKDRRQIRDHAKVIRLRRRAERRADAEPRPTASDDSDPAQDDSLLEAIERRRPGARGEVARTRLRARWSAAMAGVADIPLLDAEELAAVLTEAEVSATEGALAQAQNRITQVKAARTAGLRIAGGQQ